MPVPQASKMSAPKLIHNFSRHPAAFGFQASLPPDNITLNPANMRTYQTLADCVTGTGAASHAILDTEQLPSHTRALLADTITSA